MGGYGVSIVGGTVQGISAVGAGIAQLFKKKQAVQEKEGNEVKSEKSGDE